jgi:hypothetical protein
MNVVKLYKWTIASAVSVLVLLLLPSQVFPKTPHGIIELDKVVHAILFGAVTAVFCAEYRAWKKKTPPFFISLIVIGTFAFLTEASQLATKTRHFDMKDFGADMIGIGAALLIMKLAAIAHTPSHSHKNK